MGTLQHASWGSGPGRGSGVDVGAGRALHASWVVLGGGPSLHSDVGAVQGGRVASWALGG